MSRYDIKDALDSIFAFLDTINKYVDEKAPWILIKDEKNNETVRHILYTVAESLRIASLLLYPFFPEKMTELFNKL
jgi:methionyl-tRNA synthetase